VHARGIYIYLCVYTLCSRLIYIVVISEAIFFFVSCVWCKHFDPVIITIIITTTQMAHLAGILLLLYISMAPAQSTIIAPGETVCAHEDEPFLFSSLFFPSLLQHYIHTSTGMVTYITRPYYGPAAKNASCAFALIVWCAVHIIYIFRGGPPVTDGKYRRAYALYIYKHTHTHQVYNI